MNQILHSNPQKMVKGANNVNIMRPGDDASCPRCVRVFDKTHQQILALNKLPLLSLRCALTEYL